MSLEGRNYSGVEKAKILKKHFIGGASISDVCAENGIAPVQFYRWQHELFERGGEILESKRGRRKSGISKEAERIKKLEAKLREKDEVLSELLTEYVTVKKKNGLI